MKLTTTTIFRKTKKGSYDNNQYKFPTSMNCTHYTISETIKNIKHSKLIIKQFYLAATKKQRPIIICPLPTLYRHHKRYKSICNFSTQGDDCFQTAVQS